MGRLGSYGGEDSPLDISRVSVRLDPIPYTTGCPNERPFTQGVFAGEVGTPRLLKLFAKYNIKTTWFIPGAFMTLQKA